MVGFCLPLPVHKFKDLSVNTDILEEVVQFALAEVMRVSQFLEKKLIFFLSKIDCLAINDQIGCLFFSFNGINVRKCEQREDAENEYNQQLGE